LTEECIESSA
jgi:hypothetical protein